MPLTNRILTRIFPESTANPIARHVLVAETASLMHPAQEVVVGCSQGSALSKLQRRACLDATRHRRSLALAKFHVVLTCSSVSEPIDRIWQSLPLLAVRARARGA